MTITEQLQSRIDAAHAAGGGIVEVEAGRHEIGTLVLRSRVTLHLAPGSVLAGSPRLTDYRQDVSLFVCGSGQERGRALIYAEEAEDVAIIGQGTIDGGGAAFMEGSADWGKRPFLCRFLRCRRLRLRDISLRNAAAWSAHFALCEDVSLSDLTIHAHANRNNDGIDLDSCRRVRVTGCDIDTEDDAICLKATHASPCEDIVVTGCTLRSLCGAIKLGTESYGDMRGIVIGRCTIRDTPGGAIKLLCVDGGRMEDIVISDVVVRRSTGPVFVRLGDRRRTYQTGDAPRTGGKLRRVIISNLLHSEPLDGMPKRHGIVMVGLAEAPIEEVCLSRVRVEVPGGARLAEVPQEFPQKPATFPDLPMFGLPPAHGLWARHVRGLRVENLDFIALAPDERPERILDDVTTAPAAR